MHPFKNKYQSRINFCGESKSRLEIKEFPVDMPFPEGVPDFGLHTSILDKPCSALADAWLKIMQVLN